MQVINNKELTPIKAQATKALSYSEKLEIKTDEEEAKAIAELTKINTIGDNAKELKDKLSKPHKDGMEVIKELFAPVEANVKASITAIKAALKIYYDKRMEKQNKEIAKINDKAESGEISLNKAVEKRGKLGEVATSVKAGNGGVSYKKVTKARLTITNEMLVSMGAKELTILAKAGHLLLDEAKMKKDALADKAVFGAETYEDTEISNRRK